MTLEDFGYLDVDEQLSWLRENTPDFLDRIESTITILRTIGDDFNSYVDDRIDYINVWYENHEELAWINSIVESYEYVYVDDNDPWDEFRELNPEEFVNIVEYYRDFDTYPFEDEADEVEEKPAKPDDRCKISCEGLEALI